MQPGELDLSPRSVELPASMDSWDDLFGFVQSEADRCLGGDAKEYRLVLACEELISNIIRYNEGCADDGSVVTVRIRSELLAGDASLTYQLQISDNGKEFDPRFETLDTSLAEVPIEKRKVGGLGLFLIKTSVDHVAYRYEDKRNLYTIETDLSSQPLPG